MQKIFFFVPSSPLIRRIKFCGIEFFIPNRLLADSFFFPPWLEAIYSRIYLYNLHLQRLGGKHSRRSSFFTTTITTTHNTQTLYRAREKKNYIIFPNNFFSFLLSFQLFFLLLPFVLDWIGVKLFLCYFFHSERFFPRVWEETFESFFSLFATRLLPRPSPPPPNTTNTIKPALLTNLPAGAFLSAPSFLFFRKEGHGHYFCTRKSMHEKLGICLVRRWILISCRGMKIFRFNYSMFLFYLTSDADKNFSSS